MQFLLRPLYILRAVLVTAYFLPHTMMSAIVVLALASRKGWRRQADWGIGILWAKTMLSLSGTVITVRGHENWPASGRGFLVLFNHTSWVDILVMASGLPGVPRFGAKIELFRIPLFGRAMRNVGMLPIERNNRSKVLNVYKEAQSRAASGEFFALAPEGTRQAERKIGRFKQGPFLFAVGAQMPIVPIVIAGAREVMPRSSWLLNPWHWKSPVLVEILPSIPTVGLTEADIPSLQDRVRNAMEPVYEKLKAELGQESAATLTAATHFENNPSS